MAVNRKLVAVVMADVVGYSRLMERDEAGTHQRLRALHESLVSPKIAEHGGRTVKTTGDGMLLEFPSATAAVRCAVEIQREMGTRNLQVARDDRIELRIGINLGDIIVEGDDIVGDGVNVAARLESLAEPGGICVASAIWEQVHEDLGVEFIDAGQQQVKNIRKPIHVYRVALTRDGPSGTGVLRDRARTSWARVRARSTLGIAALIGLALFAAWQASKEWGDDAAAHTAPPLRTVMILPFSAPGDDPALSAAAKQLTVDITRQLADSMRYVRVVPPAEAAAHAARYSEPRALGRESNVRFLVDGEVRSSEAQMALTMRLTDTRDAKQVESGRSLVAPSELASGEAARKVTSATRVMLVSALGRESAKISEAAASAEDLVDRAVNVPLADDVARERESRRLAAAAIKRDPNLERAYAARAVADVELYYDDFAAPARELQEEADADSLRAVTLDPSDAGAWLARSMALRTKGNMAASLSALDRGRELDPTRYSASFLLAQYYLDNGRPAETLRIVEQLRPLIGATFLAGESCAAYVTLGDYDRAVPECEQAAAQSDNWNWQANLTAAHAMRGDMTKAEQAKQRMLKAAPLFTLSRYEERFYPTLPPEMIAMDRATFLAGLRKAGVPE